MRAAAIDRSGGPEVLSIQLLPVPVPDAREVLIAVDTAGVGGLDAEMREGWSPSGRTRFPLVLGRHPRVPAPRARRGEGEAGGADGSLCTARAPPRS
jgi:hypothetical protein